MKVHRFIVTIAIFLAPVTLGAEHTKDSLDKVKLNLSQDKAMLFDVREQREWDEGHLADAKLVPLSKLRSERNNKDFAEQLAKDAPKNKIIYCHCGSGVRVLPAAKVLEELGYDVRPLKQGFDELIEAGFPKAE